MEKDNQSRTIKVTIKMTSDKTTNNSSSTTSDLPVRVEPEQNSTNLAQDSLATVQEQVDVSSPGEVENPEAENGDNPYQIVAYKPEAEDERSSTENVVGPNGDYQPRLVPRRRSSSLQPSIGSFTVQCCNCFKWRIVPTKEKYEEIREHIIEEPFFCEQGKEWKPELSCDEPPDIIQDETRLWAIDRPNIPRPPPGWQRLLKFRVEGSSKFADVYYVAPSGKRFRSMVEVQRYLDENPHYKEEGVDLTKFSFQIPKPLQEDYVRKRSAPDHGTTESADVTEVQPISWVSQDGDIEPQFNGLESSTQSSKSPENGETEPAKKRKLTKKKSDEDLSPVNQNAIEVE